ncbi:unnamed protein product [Prunus armeniaca]|uniref:Uncharacterized protein n=1 Tax=Prunus armeniaca TaxID=36596 RepID=A0A6J5X8D5_PRUAR|nr:unnamed protein product [Prunus armeniaca]
MVRRACRPTIVCLRLSSVGAPRPCPPLSPLSLIGVLSSNLPFTFPSFYGRRRPSGCRPPRCS